MDLLRALGGFLKGLWRPLGRLEANVRAKMAPSWIWEASWEGLGGFSGRLEAKLRAKMVPSWVPKQTQNEEKTYEKKQLIFGCMLAPILH